MIESIKSSLSKYVDFSGTATRREYWTFYLFFIVASIISGIIDGILGIETFGTLIFFASILPLISCGARRMHDIGKSGWFLVIPLYNLFLLVQPSASSS